MADNDFTDGIEDDDAHDDFIEAIDVNQTSRYLLPRAIVEDAIGMDGIAELRTKEHCCVVISAPASDWVQPINALVRTYGDWEYHFMRIVPLKPRSTDLDTATEKVVRALSSGGRVLGVSHDVETLLPPVMLASADTTIKLAPPSWRVVAAVIKAVTGEVPPDRPDSLVEGLSFTALASAIRSGSTVEQCIGRLEQAGVGSRKAVDPTTDVPEIADLYGYGEAKVWGMNLVQDLKAWRRGEVDFESIERNVVLSSPPGMGKTTFARSLAKSTGMPLIATSVSDWFAKSPGYLDSIIKQIDEVFATARSMSPSIVLLDEIDAIPNRATISPRGADWWLPVITHILTTLDGAISNATSRVIVVGATNHAERLDSALVRPGRLSRVITIELPDHEALIGILRQHLGSDLPDVDLGMTAHLAFGATGAEIRQWVKMARNAARRSGEKFAIGHLDAAIAPAEARDAAYLHRVAIHEAGHAVAGHLNGYTVETISIVQSSTRGGYVQFVDNDGRSTRAAFEARVQRHLGGRAAEELAYGEVSGGSGGSGDSDLAKATNVIGAMQLSMGLGDTLVFRSDIEEVPLALARSPALTALVERDLKQLYQRTLTLLEPHMDKIEAVARALIEHRHIDGSRFLRIMATELAAAGRPST